MSQTVEELTLSYIVDGQETVQELDKIILSKGLWVTILFRYRDWNRTKKQYGEDKYSIRRYQKRNGEYRQQSKFNISSPAQARLIINSLQGWLKEQPTS